MLLVGCKSEGEPVLLASGVYLVQATAEVDLPEADDLEGVQLDIDVDALTAELSGTDDDRILEMVRLPEDKWGESCPKGVHITPLETFELGESLTLGGTVLEVPRIFAAGCTSDEGTTVTSGWLSSESEMQSAPSDGPFELTPAP